MLKCKFYCWSVVVYKVNLQNKSIKYEFILLSLNYLNRLHEIYTCRFEKIILDVKNRLEEIMLQVKDSLRTTRYIAQILKDMKYSQNDKLKEKTRIVLKYQYVKKRKKNKKL